MITYTRPARPAWATPVREHFPVEPPPVRVTAGGLGACAVAGGYVYSPGGLRLADSVVRVLPGQWLDYRGARHRLQGELDVNYTTGAVDPSGMRWLVVREHAQFSGKAPMPSAVAKLAPLFEALRQECDRVGFGAAARDCHDAMRKVRALEEVTDRYLRGCLCSGAGLENPDRTTGSHWGCETTQRELTYMRRLAVGLVPYAYSEGSPESAVAHALVVARTALDCTPDDMRAAVAALVADPAPRRLPTAPRPTADIRFADRRPQRWPAEAGPCSPESDRPRPGPNCA